MYSSYSTAVVLVYVSKLHVETCTIFSKAPRKQPGAKAMTEETKHFVCLLGSFALNLHALHFA
jgi:hypothetical protein